MTECVLCDWQPDPLARPWAVYPPGDWLPLTWDASRIEPHQVALADTLASSWQGVALVHHWAEAHPGQLLSLIGRWEVDGWPRQPRP